MPFAFDPRDTSNLSAPFRSVPVASGALAVFSGGRRSDRYFAAWLMAGELGLPFVQSTVPVAGCVAFLDWQPVPGSDAYASPAPSWLTDVLNPRISVSVGDVGISIGSPVADPTSGEDGLAITTPFGGISADGGGNVHVVTPVSDLHFGPGASGGTLRTPNVLLPAVQDVPTPGDILNLGGGAADALASLLADLAIPRGSVVVLSLAEPLGILDAVAAVAVHFSAKSRPSPVPPPWPVPHGSQDRIDQACHFDVAIDGISYGFSEVTALACASHGSRGTMYPNLVLRRAITLDHALQQWRTNLVAGQADVRPVTITHLSAATEPLRTWWIEGAWPVRWTGPSFDALGSGLAMEEVELVVSGVRWI